MLLKIRQAVGLSVVVRSIASPGMAARRSGFRRYAEGFPGIEGILRKIEGILPKYPLDLLQYPADLPSYLAGFPNYPIDLLFYPRRSCLAAKRSFQIPSRCAPLSGRWFEHPGQGKIGRRLSFVIGLCVLTG